MPLYSTGCDLQGTINAELLTKPETSDTAGEHRYRRLRATRQLSASGNASAAAPNSSNLSPFPPLDYLESLPRPELGSVPYGQVITTCQVPGTIALTFDDGPWMYTTDLLDLLEREGVHATFFVCGSNMARDQITGYGHPAVLRRMFSAGHQIGSHTWAHPDLATLSDDEVQQQMWLNEQALVGVLGLLPTYLRPPYLSWAPLTLEILTQLGYHVVSVNLDTLDWQGDYDAARQTFLAALDGGDPSWNSELVLSHDIHERTVFELAKYMIDQAKLHGYRLVTVGECLEDNIGNWYRNPYDGRSWQSRG